MRYLIISLFCKIVNDFGLLLIVNKQNYFVKVSADLG